jgi:hypothetical protein
MPKSLLLFLAAASLLFAALVLGRQAAPRGAEVHVSLSATPSARPSVHARMMVHASSHERTAIDDDDESDDSDDVESAMVAPEDYDGDDVSSDAAGDAGSTTSMRLACLASAGSLRLIGRGIRPAGEHRSAADRPPRG